MTIYLYVTQTPPELEKLLEEFRDEFDTLLEDTFTDDELQQHAAYLDELASAWPQEIIEGLSFEDFTPDPQDEIKQRDFFQHCRACLCLENAPYLENNPFQVTYLLELLKRFPRVLVDMGDALMFDDAWVRELKKLRGMDVFIKDIVGKPAVKVAQAPTHVDRVVGEIYVEVNRLRALGKLPDLESLAEKRKKLLTAVLEREATADELLVRSGLIPKDFGDGLEGLKFFLRKLT